MSALHTASLDARQIMCSWASTCKVLHLKTYIQLAWNFKLWKEPLVVWNLLLLWSSQSLSFICISIIVIHLYLNHCHSSVDTDFQVVSRWITQWDVLGTAPPASRCSQDSHTSAAAPSRVGRIWSGHAIWNLTLGIIAVCGWEQTARCRLKLYVYG